MAKTGRKPIYDDKVKPRFAEIEGWIKNGASEKQCAEQIGIGISTWMRFKNEKEEFRAFLKSIDRVELVKDLRSALIKKALGFTYEEKKQYIKKDEITGNQTSYTEISTKQALPDVAAINLALKNYDRDSWANDPQMLELKKQELELRKQIAEENNW